MEDGEHVGAGAGKLDVVEEGGAVGGGGAGLPFEDVAAAGVVIGEGEGGGIVGGAIAAEGVAQVPGPGKNIGDRIEAVFVLEGGDALRGGPFVGGRVADLHEAEFAGAPDDARIEAAFAPDNGFDQRGVELIAARGGGDGVVEAVFLPMVVSPKQGEESRAGESGKGKLALQAVAQGRSGKFMN